MRLYLVQHGEAKSEEVDPERSLTEKGIRDVQAVAAFLKPQGLKVKAILHSGKTRAKQTAEILEKSIQSKKGMVQHKGLSPKDDIRPVAEEILDKKDDLVIVGHLPFLNRLASKLLTGEESAEIVAFQQGGVVCLELNKDHSPRVAWMIIPELLHV